ncbi:hypothetical protein SLE2022_281190 [Rubroshorea leprosula]
MSGAPRDLNDSAEQNRDGPDYFSYYTHEIARLFSENEDILVVPQTSNTPGLSERKCRETNEKERIDSTHNADGPSFSNSIGASVSDFMKERLKALLMQSVNDLSREVDEIVDPVLAMHQLKCQLQSKNRSGDSAVASNGDAGQVKPKKLKMSPSSLSAGVTANSRKEEDNDLQFLLQSDGQLVEQTLKKYSDELSNTLGHMEQRLEDLLDTLVAKCRPMTPAEKRHLQKLIQKLPRENIDRIVEIICHKKPADKKYQDEIFVNLELEENATLWRLYFYVQAVENAKELAR